MLRSHPDLTPDIPGFGRIDADSHATDPDWSGLCRTNLDKSGLKRHKFAVQHTKLSKTSPKSPPRQVRSPPANSEGQLLAAVPDVEAAEAGGLDFGVGSGLGEVEALAGDGGEVVLAGALQALDVACQRPDVVQVLPGPADR